MRRKMLFAALAGVMAVALVGTAGAGGDDPQIRISGAGATFPYPIYAKWAEAYKAATGVRMNYQSIGSGGGIRQIEAGTVDFGASDMPLAPDVLAAKGLQQWPMVMGGIVLVVNLPGIRAGDMKLDGETVANMYLGRIAYWDDPALKSLNPHLRLPHQAIATVHRSDGSGTNFIFTHYLSQISATFRNEIGESTSVEFPGGIGGKGNEGVAALTSRTNGAIGYVEYAYALQNNMAYTLLRNQAGFFVSPNNATFQAAAASADWAHAPGFHLLLTNQPGKDSWPITGATFILMRQRQATAATAWQALSFFDWCYRNGEMAKSLDYVPMPDPVVALIKQSWQTIIGPDGTSVWR